MSSQENSKGIPNATSLQESEAGPLPCAWLDGQMNDPSGLAPAPVSPSAPQEGKKVYLTNATFGQYGVVSSESAALQASMESRLQVLLDSGGLTGCMMTWKTTPSGRQYCQLVPLAHRTEETDYGLWPTPSSRDWKDSPGMTAQRKDGKSREDQLPRVVHGVSQYTSPAETAKPALSPRFVSWLMGYTQAHCASMQKGMKSR